MTFSRQVAQTELGVLYQDIFPHLLQVEKLLQEVGTRGKGLLPEISRYVVQAGGKRLRPALVVLGAQMGGVSVDEAAVVGAAAELIHLATLIHDDIVDQSCLRHQKPTVAVQYGEEVALLLGDYLYVEAFSLLASINDPFLLNLFARTTRAMCEGEINQVRRRFQWDLVKEEYLSFIDNKTATLMGTCLRAGARLARLTPDLATALGHFGWSLGMAFQIVDDTLDLIGEENVTGKTLRNDLANGKLTLPVILFRDRLSEKERAPFLESLQRSEDGLATGVEKLKTSGAIREGLQHATQFAGQAKAALRQFPSSTPKKTLETIADHIVTRTR